MTDAATTAYDEAVDDDATLPPLQHDTHEDAAYDQADNRSGAKQLGWLEHLTPPDQIDRFIEEVIKALLLDLSAERIVSSTKWCNEWRRHPLVSLHLHAAFLAFPGWDQEEEDPARAMIYWRNSYFDPLVSLLTGEHHAFKRCQSIDGHVEAHKTQLGNES